MALNKNNNEQICKEIGTQRETSDPLLVASQISTNHVLERSFLPVLSRVEVGSSDNGRPVNWKGESGERGQDRIGQAGRYLVKSMQYPFRLLPLVQLQPLFL